jgi:RimJ/RimL family protein N-acetyltransferase
VRFALIEGFDRQVCDFVASRAPFDHCDFREGDKGFAVVRDGKMVAGVVFSGWKPAFASVELSIVAVSYFALSPQIVAALGGYAFEKLLANRVWARTSIKNHRAVRLLEHVGAIREGIEADYYGPGEHAGMYRMLKREWIEKYAKPPWPNVVLGTRAA